MWFTIACDLAAYDKGSGDAGARGVNALVCQTSAVLIRHHSQATHG
jgi:hypothetical protein